jgi:hypothetical protein
MSNHFELTLLWYWHTCAQNAQQGIFLPSGNFWIDEKIELAYCDINIMWQWSKRDRQRQYYVLAKAVDKLMEHYSISMEFKDTLDHYLIGNSSF